MQLTEKTVLITGGSSGLGAGCARHFASLGVNVVILDLNEASGAALEQEIGPRALFVKTDVTSEEDVEAAIEAAVDQFGRIHGLINCAGIAIGERVVGRQGPHGLDSFTKVIQINLVGTFNMIRLTAAVMALNNPSKSGERGVIINTASIAAFDGQIGQAAYAASKGGIVGMTLPIARELARFGIRVMTIAPGIFYTPMLGSMPQEVQDSLAAQVPFPNRLGTPHDFAQMAQQIFENEMLNGETIRLDGAIRMAPK